MDFNIEPQLLNDLAFYAVVSIGILTLGKVVTKIVVSLIERKK